MRRILLSVVLTVSLLGAARVSLMASAGSLLLSILLGCAAPLHAQALGGARIEQAEKEPQNWLTYFGNYRAWSFSPLNQITRENVKQLVPVWAFSTGELRGGLTSAPLVIDGVLYLIGPRNRLFALDAATGTQIWSYFYPLPDRSTPLSNGTRGIAFGYGMLYLGTLDNHLVAIDAKTGHEAWNVEIEDARKCGCNVTSAPLVVKDKVIVGVTGGDSAHRGYLNAFDAETGKHIWRFNTIPAPGEPGSETWSEDSWKWGGASTWFTGSYDPELNLVYWGVGNPSSDFYGEGRKGTNLYSDSLIALDADTGRLRWYYQETPHDLYDFDSDPEPVLIDVFRDGRERKIVLHASKNGYAYVLDRETGRFINAFPYAQRITWTKGLDKDGKPTGVVIPEAGKDYLFCPGASGGRNWVHSAYSPRTDWWYNTGFEVCNTITPKKMEVAEGESWLAGDRVLKPSPTTSPHIDAFDPVTGKIEWTHLTKYVNVSSLLATAGDLIFGGDVEGSAFALDAKTGEKIWSFNTGGGIGGPTVSFSVKGRQYVAVPSGGGVFVESFVPAMWPESRSHFPQPASTLFVFALPESSQ
jgi:alcohol dehydrogenase (cytochrome c)